MKKTEKILCSLFTIALGVLLVVLKGDLISIIMTVLGVGLLALSVLDLFRKQFPPAVVKGVGGIVVVLCGWVIVSAVLYIVAGILLIVGILLLYEKIKRGNSCDGILEVLCEYVAPALCIVIGVLLLFNQRNTADWVFVISGIFSSAVGGILFVGAIVSD